jgi:hypothetical protein
MMVAESEFVARMRCNKKMKCEVQEGGGLS